MTKKRGRIPNAVRTVRVVLSGWLHPEFDADILDWLRGIPKGQRMNAFKTALRSCGMMTHSVPASNTEDAQQAAEDILGNWEF